MIQQHTEEIKQSLGKFIKTYQPKKLSRAKDALLPFWPDITKAIKKGVPKGALFNFLIANGIVISRYQFLKVLREIKKAKV